MTTIDSFEKGCAGARAYLGKGYVGARKKHGDARPYPGKGYGDARPCSEGYGDAS